MSDEVRKYILAAMFVIVLIAVGWYGWIRLYGRYHQAEPPSREQPLPRI